MKCNKCGNEWQISNRITSSTYVCPYCGETFGDDGQSKKNLGEIIAGLRQSFGENILDDPARLNSILMDFAPDMPKERKLIVNALKEGILTQFLRGIEGSREDIKVVAQRCVAMLVSDMWITEAAARYVMDVVLVAFGFSPILSDVVAPDITPDTITSAPVAQPDYRTVLDKTLNKGDKDFGTIVTENDLKDYAIIGYKAFAANSEVTQIIISGNIQKIHPKAFSGCSSLREINLSGADVPIIGRNAFEGCVELSTISMPNNSRYGVINHMLIDKSEKLLMRYLHSESKTIQIQNGIRTVCRKSFEDPEIEKVHIPGTVDKIEEDAFYLTTHLTAISVDKANRHFRAIDGVLHNSDGKILLKYPQGNPNISYYLEDSVERIDRKAFSHCANLVSITFNNALKEIGARAFEYCVELENIILPRSVVLVGERTFQYCEKLSSIMLPYGIKEIGEYAFQGCNRLKTINVPKSVEKIGNMAFVGCKSLTSVVIQENVCHIGEGAFIDCPQVKVLIAGNAYAETYCRSHGIPYSKK